MTHVLNGAMSILFGMLIVPLFGQNGITVSIFEYPEPMIFSSEQDFIRGVSSTLTLLVSNSLDLNEDGESDDDDDDFDHGFEKWKLSIRAEGNLSNGSYSIPISSIWAKAKRNSRIRSTGKVFLSNKYQTIARSKPGFFYSNHFFIEIKLKAYKRKRFLKPSGEYSTYIYFTLMMD
jgi:hypothetical protein